MEHETESVRLWRSPGPPDVLLMRGRTRSYGVEPNGEYFAGVIGGHAMVAERGGVRHVVRPGELVVWDPSAPHAGRAADGTSAWLGHLMVIELPALAEMLYDEEALAPDLAFPDPVVADRRLAAGFLHLHRALTEPVSALERDTLLTDWLHALAARAPSTPRSRSARRLAADDPALRRACAYLDTHLEANTTLDELARVAGVGRFRLIRLFRDALGVPPHRYQVAQRLRRARRLLEAGEPIADVASATGFADQSHMHRHFRRGLGVTPRQYVARLSER